ncbi:hypothetical protein Tco_1109312 [Tanacetum coccineum]
MVCLIVIPCNLGVVLHLVSGVFDEVLRLFVEVGKFLEDQLSSSEANSDGGVDWFGYLFALYLVVHENLVGSEAFDVGA